MLSSLDKKDPMKTTELSGVVSLDLTTRPELPQDYKAFLEVARTLQVIDEESFAIANEMVLRQDAWDKSVDAFFDKGRDLAYRSWKWFTETITATKKPMEVRSVLVPRMKKYRADQDRIKREAEERARREREEAERQAREEAARIQREADAAAAQLRQQGEMRAAREAQEQAQQAAQAVVQQAEAIAEVGVILPSAKPAGGPGEAYPWVGEVVNMKALCKAIGDGVIPLEYAMPVRGQGDQMRPLVVVDQALLNHIAKRMGREDIGLAGCVGKRDLQLRFGAQTKAKGREW